MQFQIHTITIKGSFYSNSLERLVNFRFVAPSNYWLAQKGFSVLLMNDGQDYDALRLEQTLTKKFLSTTVIPFVYIGIDCNENRIHEYGTAGTADFKGRGGQANKYSKCIIDEFVPFLKKEFKVSKHGMDWVFCGMSLGGLSAFDIVFNHSDVFGKVGVFSGSFWWRKKAYVKNDIADRSRIVLDLVKNGNFSPHLQFWFQCGTKDETADRNHNGIIDAIEDTQDLIKELKSKGYKKDAITYLEVLGGKHDLPTWGSVFPTFLDWAFSTNT